jgi:hypothetical protein
MTAIRFVAQVNPISEHEHTAITEWFEPGDVTTIEATLDAGSRAGTSQLHFGVRAGTQSCGRLDQCRATADVDHGDVLAGPHERV